VPTALEGFRKLECDAVIAGQLRAEIAAADGFGYDHFAY
jgi:hypothetical protein